MTDRYREAVVKNRFKVEDTANGETFGPFDKPTMIAIAAAMSLGHERSGAKELLEAAQRMAAAMQHFVDRVDRGEIRSRKTYAAFKNILAANPEIIAKGQDQ